MMRRRRLPEILLAALALAGVAALFIPLSPAPLPSRHQGPGAAAALAAASSGQATAAGRAASSGQATAAVKDPALSVAEAASLFIPHRTAPALRPQEPAELEKAPWLHFTAYVVSSNGQTIYFFKNDQTGRIVMLAYNQPHDGWNLAGTQGEAYILEKEGHRYTVMKK